MCGLSGVISNVSISMDAIEESLASIKHRGPDNTLISDTRDIFSSKLSNKYTLTNIPRPKENLKSKVWLGFNRLSIVDFSENAMQPFYDEKSGCYFMLNGEIYNYQQLKDEHLSTHHFESNSDSEVAFKMYLKYGDDFVDYLQGMFAIVIYSSNTKKLKVWRDRLGIKPFYFYHQDEKFIFSSEIKGVLATNLVDKKPNFKGIAYSMYLGTCPSPVTIYHNIASLQPGHRLTYTIDSDELEIRPYWILTYKPASRKINYQEFNEDITGLCKLYNTGDVDRAIMLSGGIDSGTLAYFFGLINKEMKAITIFQENSSNNELEFTKDNATNAGLNLESFEIPSNQNIDIQNEYLLAEEEPNSIPEPAVFISKIAKKRNVRILYNALGPDEIFGGYPYFQQIKKISKYRKMLPIIPPLLLPKGKREKLKDLKKFGLHNFAFISRSRFTWNEIVDFLLDNHQDIPTHPISFVNDQINSLYPDFTDIPLLKKVSYLDIYYNIASHHTLRSDLPSMKYSIEMRFPFLEHTFIEKYYNQSDTFDHISDVLKPKMRAYAKNFLSEKVLNMPKKGFTIDVNQWQKDTPNKKDWYLLGLKGIFGLDFNL